MEGLQVWDTQPRAWLYAEVADKAPTVWGAQIGGTADVHNPHGCWTELNNHKCAPDQACGSWFAVNCTTSH